MAHDQEHAESLDDVYGQICIAGFALLGSAEGPDEWPYLVEAWLLQHRPEVLERGLHERDVVDAFAAWEIGTAVEKRAS